MRHGAGLAAAALGALLGCANPFARPAWERPPPLAVDAPVVPEAVLHRAELGNGMHILVLEDHRLPRVALGVTVRRGSASEPPGEAGLALYMAEVMERGAGSRDALALAEAVERLGARFAVSSGWDSTTVALAGLSRDQGELFGILGDAVRRPRFDAQEARRARDETLAALEQAKDDPETLAAWSFARAVYAGHRYGIPREGVRESALRFDAKAARGLHARLFVPNDAILWASGDVDPESFMTRAREVFGAWKQGPVADPGLPPPDPAPAQRRVLVVDRPDLEQARIVLGHEGIAREDPERIAVALMNDVLGGGGFSSRLMDTLRSQAGLTYGVASGFSLRRHRGPFTVSTFTRVAEVRRALDLALAVIERFRREPPDEKELQDARALAVGEFSLGLETSDAVRAALVDLDVYGLPEDSLDTYRGRVRATTVPETAELAQRLLHPERAAIVLVGPAEKLLPQLDGLGPVEVVKP